MTHVNFERRKLRVSGNKATPQRLCIMEAIGELRSQFTPQQLYARLRQTHPEIGLVTVYRTLSLLAGNGLICRMGYIGRAQSYACCPEEHHHHLVCTGCNKVVDISACGLGEMEKKLASETGFTINNHHLEFMGLCRQCQAISSRET